MMSVETGSPRDAAGRWVAGMSGNPAGKRPGTRNRATLLRAALRDGEDMAAVRVIIDKAVAGNLAAARVLLDGVAPKPRGRPIELDLPADANVDQAIDATVRAMLAGEVSPDEALLMTRLLHERRGRGAAAASEPAVEPRPSAAAGAARAKPPVRRPAAIAPAFALHWQASEAAAPPVSLTASLLATTSLTGAGGARNVVRPPTAAPAARAP